MLVSKDILFVVYTRTSHLIKSSSVFRELSNMSKIHYMKKVNEYLNIFRKYVRVRQDISDEIQTSTSFIKDELQTSIETNISSKKAKEKMVLVEWVWTKTIAHYEFYGKAYHKREHNIKEYHTSG